jgi:ribosomal protein L40E
LSERRIALIIFGVVLILVGIIIPFLYFTYSRNIFTGQVLSYDFPLLPYGVAVGLLGVIVVVIGFVIRDEPPKSVAPVPYVPPAPSLVPKKYCRFCGSENKNDAVFCEKCGRQIGDPKSSLQPTRLCANCGEELNAEDTWCRKCGTVVSSRP